MVLRAWDPACTESGALTLFKCWREMMQSEVISNKSFESQTVIALWGIFFIDNSWLRRCRSPVPVCARAQRKHCSSFFLCMLYASVAYESCYMIRLIWCISSMHYLYNHTARQLPHKRPCMGTGTLVCDVMGAICSTAHFAVLLKASCRRSVSYGEQDAYSGS